MLGFYNYTVVLTYISAISAVIGTVVAADTDRNYSFVSIICLLICGLCDMFDGKIARTKKDRTGDEKAFGIQIDSLSDLLAFGILPAAIGYSCGLNRWYHMVILAAYVLCALIRLAYFNVTEEMRQREEGEAVRKHYEGLPVTSSALIFPATFLFKMYLKENFYIFYGICITLVAVLFVARFKLKKPDTHGLIIMLIVGAFIFAGVLLVYLNARKII